MASLDLAREHDYTYLKKHTTSDGRLAKLSKDYARIKRIALAFDKLIGDGSDDACAIRFLGAYHAPSAGYDTTSSPAYLPPEGMSPISAWRGGPTGGSTVIELATTLIADPLSGSARRAFLLGRADQLSVIRRLYLTAGDKSFTELKQLVVRDPLSVSSRLLEVYNVLIQAAAIVDDEVAERVAVASFRQRNLVKQESQELDGQVEDAEAPIESISVEEVTQLVNSSVADQLLKVITPLAEGLDSDRKKVSQGIEEMARKAQLLDARLDEASRQADASEELKATSPSTAELLDKIAMLGSQLQQLQADKEDDRAAFGDKVAALRLENAKLSENVREATGCFTPSAAVAPMVSLTTPVKGGALGGTLSPAPAPPPGEDAPLVSWSDLPKPAGLEGTKPPDFKGAWLSRPREGEEGKVARKEFVSSLSQEKLLSSLPAPGDAIAYGVVRGSLLENFYLHATYLHGGGERGEVALLRSLHAAAAARYKTDGKTESHWRSLMSSESVRAFIIELDSVYADNNHTASEEEWENAKRDATDALDLFTRLKHLLTSDLALNRCRSALTKYLAAQRESHTMTELMQCDLHDLQGWHRVLDAQRSVKKQMEAAASPPVEAAGRRKVAAMTKSKTEDSRYDGGSILSEADVTLEESSLLIQTLLDIRKKLSDQNEGQAEATREVNRKLAAFTSGGGGNAGGGYGGGSFRPSDPPMVWNLPAIKEFTGTEKPVPERRGPHPNGTHGEECFACSFFGFKFDVHGSLLEKGFPTGWRAYHNAWKCTKIPKFVEAKAEEKGASREEVEKVLTMIPDPAWKPRGV